MNRESERKRLVELLKHECDVDGRYDGEGNCPGCKYNGMEDCSLQELADHILDNGIVVPPVKVGQTVWEVVSWDKNVRECRVSSLTQKADGTFKIRLTNLKSKSVYERVPQHIGDIIFLTREEAEKMLKGEEK